MCERPLVSLEAKMTRRDREKDAPGRLADLPGVIFFYRTMDGRPTSFPDLLRLGLSRERTTLTLARLSKGRAVLPIENTPCNGRRLSKCNSNAFIDPVDLETTCRSMLQARPNSDK
jgi:hypothetical protein